MRLKKQNFQLEKSIKKTDVVEKVGFHESQATVLNINEPRYAPARVNKIKNGVRADPVIVHSLFCYGRVIHRGGSVNSHDSEKA